MEKSSKITTLYVITKSVWAGAGKYTYDLATSLSSDKFDVHVAAGGQGVLAQKIKQKNITYHEIESFQRDVSFFKDLSAFFEILALLFKTKPNVVHVSSSKAGGIAGAAIWAYKIFKSPVTIFTAHGWAFSEPRSKIQTKLIKIFSKFTCLFYDKIICVSEYDKQIALKNNIAPKNKLITIQNGIKSEDYTFLSREKAREKLSVNSSQLSDTGDQIWVGTIGEFTKNKGHKYLIDAVKMLHASGYMLHVFIIGFGEGKEKLEKQIKDLKLENNVFLIDSQGNEANYLKAFDIFVLPSVKEGLPYVLLEAGLARLPVIATNVGGVSEIIENISENSRVISTGLLVKPANPQQITEAIEKLIKETELKNNLATSLWEKIYREFSFEKMLESTQNLIAQVKKE